MERLGRYPLSVILSFLSENEGTSLLITKKRYARQLLPVFELRRDGFEGLSVRNAKRRHRFLVVPVQDPAVLLDRLNTRRLFRRGGKYGVGQSTSEIAVREWRERDDGDEDCDNDASSKTGQQGLLRFLVEDMIDCRVWRKRGTTLLVSYPRSGNTLVRSLLERITGVVTGSDTRPDRGLSRELAERHDLVGEGVTQSCLVHFVKTHWPERSGYGKFHGNRAVVVVRNPYDAIDSYWNMNATKTHTKTVTDDVYRDFRDVFEGLVKNEIDVWINFHEYWIRKAGVPVLIVRFEDLIRDAEQELRRIVKFALIEDHDDRADLPASWINRIRRAAGNDSIERLGSYRPRSASSKGSATASIGKSIRRGRYNDDLLRHVHSAANERPDNFLLRFGYDVDKQNFPENFVIRCDQDRSQLSDGYWYVPGTASRVLVNSGLPVRREKCPYGRAMYLWRHSVTNNDTVPLPTV